MSDGGKGSRPRPLSVSQQEYDTRWDAIFGRDLSEDTSEQYRVNKQGKIAHPVNQPQMDSSSRND